MSVVPLPDIPGPRVRGGDVLYRNFDVVLHHEEVCIDRKARLFFSPASQLHGKSNANAYLVSPKAPVRSALAFLDYYAPHMGDIAPTIHKALILRDPFGILNSGAALDSADSTRMDLAAFASYWSERDEHQGRGPRA